MRRRSVPALAISLAWLAAVTAACGAQQAGRPAERAASHPVAAQSPPSAAPRCAAAAGPPAAVLTVATRPGQAYFQRRCYYAPAGRAFTIRFTNSLFAVAGHRPTSLTLLISPGKDPAVARAGSTPGMYTVTPARAVFEGSPVRAPGTAVLSVPALTAGAYDLQILQLPGTSIATLIVAGTARIGQP